MSSTKTNDRLSGHQVGQNYADDLTRYLETLRIEGRGLPSRNGKVSVSAVALASGVDRQSLYKNPGCRAMLESAAQELGLVSIESRDGGNHSKDDAKERRIQTLEARCASLQAEVEGLRQKLRQFSHIEEHMIMSGRRVIP